MSDSPETLTATMPFAVSFDAEQARIEAIAMWYEAAAKRGATPTGTPTAERCDGERVYCGDGTYVTLSEENGLRGWRVSGPALRAPADVPK